MITKTFDDFNLFLEEFIKLNKKYKSNYPADNNGCLGYCFYNKDDDSYYEYILIKLSSLPEKFTSLPKLQFISYNNMLYNAIIRGFFKDES